MVPALRLNVSRKYNLNRDRTFFVGRREYFYNRPSEPEDNTKLYLRLLFLGYFGNSTQIDDTVRPYTTVKQDLLSFN